jgi:hypothetical protein
LTEENADHKKSVVFVSFEERAERKEAYVTFD